MVKLSCALLGTLAAVCISAPALAGLGGDASSVEADRASMKGVVRTTPFVDYDIHEIQTPTGTVIHEYVSAQGKVLAGMDPGCRISSSCSAVTQRARQRRKSAAHSTTTITCASRRRTR